MKLNIALEELKKEGATLTHSSGAPRMRIADHFSIKNKDGSFSITGDQFSRLHIFLDLLPKEDVRHNDTYVLRKPPVEAKYMCGCKTLFNSIDLKDFTITEYCEAHKVKA